MNYRHTYCADYGSEWLGLSWLSYCYIEKVIYIVSLLIISFTYSINFAEEFVSSDESLPAISKAVAFFVFWMNLFHCSKLWVAQYPGVVLDLSRICPSERRKDYRCSYRLRTWSRASTPSPCSSFCSNRSPCSV